MCPHVSERNEDFFVLGLDVKGKRSITESLQLYVEGEVSRPETLSRRLLYMTSVVIGQAPAFGGIVPRCSMLFFRAYGVRQRSCGTSGADYARSALPLLMHVFFPASRRANNSESHDTAIDKSQRVVRMTSHGTNLKGNGKIPPRSTFTCAPLVTG